MLQFCRRLNVTKILPISTRTIIAKCQRVLEWKDQFTMIFSIEYTIISWSFTPTYNTAHLCVFIKKSSNQPGSYSSKSSSFRSIKSCIKLSSSPSSMLSSSELSSLMFSSSMLSSSMLSSSMLSSSISSAVSWPAKLDRSWDLFSSFNSEN